MSLFPQEHGTLIDMRKKELNVLLGSFEGGFAAVGPPTNSIYSVCFVMPQIASQLTWPPGLLGRVIQCYCILVATWCIQCLYLYEILHIEQLRDEGCNQNATECLANGFVKTEGFFPDYGHWTLCTDNVGKATNLVPQVTQQLCIMVFVVSLFSDFRNAMDLARCLYRLPSKKGVWLVGRKMEEIQLGNFDAQETLDLNIQVDAVPLSWKIFYCISLVIPKVLIMVALLFVGTCYLFNESDRKELILNAVAYVFVSQIDSLLFDAVVPNDIREKLDNMQTYRGHLEKRVRAKTRALVIDDSDSDAESSSSIPTLELHHVNRVRGRVTAKYKSSDYVIAILKNLLHPVAVLVCTAAIYKFFERRCATASTVAP